MAMCGVDVIKGETRKRVHPSTATRDMLFMEKLVSWLHDSDLVNTPSFDLPQLTVLL